MISKVSGVSKVSRVSKATKGANSRTRQTVRINAGEFRSRRIGFPDRDGLRPTSDRVRETLFNWLQPVIAGARCLDLFAGSGALGIEALSRGAKAVDFVESDRIVAASIAANLEELSCETARVFNSTAHGWLSGERQYPPVFPPSRSPAAAAGVQLQEKFDIVFLDPPFAANILFQTVHQLVVSGLLAERAWVYLESGQAINEEALPNNFTVYRSKRAGDVHYILCQVGI